MLVNKSSLSNFLIFIVFHASKSVFGQLSKRHHLKCLPWREIFFVEIERNFGNRQRSNHWQFSDWRCLYYHNINILWRKLALTFLRKRFISFIRKKKPVHKKRQTKNNPQANAKIFWENEGVQACIKYFYMTERCDYFWSKTVSVSIIMPFLLNGFCIGLDEFLLISQCKNASSTYQLI